MECKRNDVTSVSYTHLLVAMMFVGMNVSAQRIRVQGHITNPQGKSVPNVNVLNPVNDERIEMSDEDGRYSVLVAVSYTHLEVSESALPVFLPSNE